MATPESNFNPTQRNGKTADCQEPTPTFLVGNDSNSLERRERLACPSFEPRPAHFLSGGPHQLAARNFSQLFGLHPIPAATTFVVNEMLFAGAVFSMGTLALLAPIVAVALGIITYKSQRRFYEDDHDAALIKALAVGLITAIPVGLPAFLTLPSAAVGLVHSLRKGNPND